MSYRVLIPTAGTGSRLWPLTKHLNKSLVNVSHKPLVSHIIDYFPKDVEFVIVLGYKGEIVRDFFTITYPKRRFLFAEVSPYEGEGSGLGLSICACEQYLRQPFIFIACDTLVCEPIPAPTCDWIGYAEGKPSEHYRTVEVHAGNAVNFFEKSHPRTASEKNYIGLAGIYHHQKFWDRMQSGGPAAITAGEVYGLQGLTGKGMKALAFTWNDTGTIETLNHARTFYKDPDGPNILEKDNETIWFVGEKVVKFCTDTTFIKNRVARADILQGFVPEILGHSNFMYCYTKASGDILSKVVTLPIFSRLLLHSKQLWQPHILDSQDRNAFNQRCMHFYKNKTYERIHLFYKTFNETDDSGIINGKCITTLESLLQRVDWNSISQGLPGRFHGDFHFENILYNTAEDKFIFLDWRQDFGGDLVIGDIYYDLAKLLHGLIVCHELINKNYFSVTWHGRNVDFDFYRKQILVECELFYYNWIVENGFDKGKVLTLTALIYLNIAALHHYPYSHMLYALGKYMLHSILEANNETH
ncbi:phosphotransferase [Desulfovibrio aerotolerans]|uniref:Phosphotransferase n=2 Tax=Solidesulfovibrio aerotolerans TaxID=295255 RepID=A0A7C9IY34_9BACT|nr:phosphotransferase [Solidesulfovibrio aerotolerans]